MTHKITLIPGDGIGPELSAAVVRVVDAAGAKVEWETFKAGAEAQAECGQFLPEALVESLRRNRVGLKGPVTTPIGEGHTSINVSLRKRLDLYVSFRRSEERRVGKECRL